MNRRSVLAFALAGLAGCSGGVPNAEEAKAEIYVLVDLSETWHNPASTDRNKRILAEIGAGIAAVAENFEPPVAVQYRVIGKASLGREPICDAMFAPSIVATTRDRPDYMITSPRKLSRYLSFDCPELIVRQPPEALTEISATIASVAQLPTRPGLKRFFIIASDFLEETGGRPPPCR